MRTNFSLFGSLIVLGLASCAYQPMESVDQKISRYEAQKRLPTPSIAATPSRNYAQNAPVKKAVKKLPYSDKQLYVISLLDQYYKIGQYASVPVKEIKHCPAVHTAFLDFNDFYKEPYYSKVLPAYNSSTYKEASPILVLPIDDDDDSDTVKKVVAQGDYKEINRAIQSAINEHVSKMYNEISYVCDQGTSQNYYAFLNLVNNPKASSVGAYKSLVHNNMAIIKTLEQKNSRSIASGINKEINSEILNRTNSQWFKDYLAEDI